MRVHQLFASCWSHSCLLIGLRSGHHTIESGRVYAVVSLSWKHLSLTFHFLVLFNVWLLLLVILCCCILHIFGVSASVIASESHVRSSYIFAWWYMLICIVCFTGIDFKIKTVELQGKKIKLQIWWVSGFFWDIKLSLRNNKVFIKLSICGVHG